MSVSPTPAFEEAEDPLGTNVQREFHAMQQRRQQRGVVQVLTAGQILGGLGIGATLTLGALLIADVSGSSAWSGMAATMGTLGAALVAVPLARLAQARGRRLSLSAGPSSPWPGQPWSSLPPSP